MARIGRRFQEECDMDTGLVVIRLVFGLVMAAHGAQKLFGWFGGYGIAGTGGFFESLGFHPGRLFAAKTASSFRCSTPPQPWLSR